MLDSEKLLFVDSNYIIDSLAHCFDIYSMQFLLFDNFICTAILTHNLIFLLSIPFISDSWLTPTVSQLQCQSCADSRILRKEELNLFVLPAELYDSLE
jgi:hypothetical protein